MKMNLIFGAAIHIGMMRNLVQLCVSCLLVAPMILACCIMICFSKFL